jgi:hypothetical protein
VASSIPQLTPPTYRLIKKFKITYRTADKERNTHWAHVGGPLPIFEAMLHGPSERPTDQAIFRERKI